LSYAPELIELYLAMMEATFKAKEGDREEKLSKLKSQLPSHDANLLKFDQQRFVAGELEADSLALIVITDSNREA
jgi:hypothetical protein